MAGRQAASPLPASSSSADSQPSASSLPSPGKSLGLPQRKMFPEKIAISPDGLFAYVTYVTDTSVSNHLIRKIDLSDASVCHHSRWSDTVDDNSAAAAAAAAANGENQFSQPTLSLNNLPTLGFFVPGPQVPLPPSAVLT
jgi:hypothetical protein